MNIWEEIQSRIKQFYESGTSEGVRKAWRTRKGLAGEGTQGGRNIIARKLRLKRAGFRGFKDTRQFNPFVRKEAKRLKGRMIRAQSLRAVRAAGFKKSKIRKTKTSYSGTGSTLRRNVVSDRWYFKFKR